jgi:hypothetical protein
LRKREREREREAKEILVRFVLIIIRVNRDHSREEKEKGSIEMIRFLSYFPMERHLLMGIAMKCIDNIACACQRNIELNPVDSFVVLIVYLVEIVEQHTRDNNAYVCLLSSLVDTCSLATIIFNRKNENKSRLSIGFNRHEHD